MMYCLCSCEKIQQVTTKQKSKNLQWFVGLKNKKWFESFGITDNVTELNWWESQKYKDLDFVFTPSQHWCARGILDRNQVNIYSL